MNTGVFKKGGSAREWMFKILSAAGLGPPHRAHVSVSAAHGSVHSRYRNVEGR